MTVVINGTTGISPVTAAGTSALVDGMTVGRGAGEVATNTAVGAGALAATASGGENSAFAAFAANKITTGVDNTTGGYGSLYFTTTGSYNTSWGAYALYSNTTASNNTAVGYQAGYSNTTSASNTFVGRGAGYSSTGVGNVLIGDITGYSLTTGTYNTFIGAPGSTGSCGYYVTTGSKNTIIGGYNGNQGGLDIRTASNYIVLSDGDGNPLAWMNSASLVKIPGVYAITGTASGSVQVDAAGQIYRLSSALKYKQDVRDLEAVDINKFRAIRYKSKCAIDDPTKDHFGVIADEVDAAGVTELVNYGADGEVEGFQYEKFTVVLLKAIQELKAEFDAYKAAHP